MPIIEPCIRPPAEAESILLQVTCGCSSNNCTFCGAYQNKQFRIKPLTEICADIDTYARHYPDVRKLFLMDGDALVLSNAKLVPILQRVQMRLPQVKRISGYANGFNITDRSPGELAELHAHNLKLVYIGLESGCQAILDRCNKKATVRQMVDGVTMAATAGISTSLMVLLGLGGKRDSIRHCEDSAAAINAMQPRYLNFLSLMIIPGTPLHAQMEQGAFEPLDSHGLLIETFEIVRRLELNQTLFFANHASNYLPLTARLPQGKEELLHTLDAAIHGKLQLKPEFLRGL
jgi:radical SAM superfamily enzyme YgiQ (UPF0313 family)